jgi:hypothetical protein
MDGRDLVLREAKLRTGMSPQRCSAWRWIQPEDFRKAVIKVGEDWKIVLVRRPRKKDP